MTSLLSFEELPNEKKEPKDSHYKAKPRGAHEAASRIQSTQLFETLPRIGEKVKHLFLLEAFSDQLVFSGWQQQRDPRVRLAHPTKNVTSSTYPVPTYLHAGLG
jgi:hypothetical protein